MYRTMSGEETLNHLFDKARKEPLETSADDVRKWIGWVTAGTMLMGLLAKLNVVFTKTTIMYSAAFLTAGIGLTTLIAFNSGSEKEVNKPGTAKTEHNRQAPLPAPAEDKAITITPRPEIPAPGNDQPSEDLPEESPFEMLNRIPSSTLAWESPEGKSIAVSTRSEEKDYGPFSKINLKNAVDVYLLQGSKESVRVEGDPDPNSLLEISNSKGTLTIGNATLKGNIPNKSQKQKVYVTVVDISRIDCSGAIHLRSEGQLQLKKVELTTSGATNVEMDLNLGELILKLSGATDVTLSGKTGFMDLDCSGASSFDASGLQVTKAKVTSKGANNTQLYITGNLEIEASGASDVKCKGNPAISKKTVTGAASFKSL